MTHNGPFAVAIDASENSKAALDWAVKNLFPGSAQDACELIVFNCHTDTIIPMRTRVFGGGAASSDKDYDEWHVTKTRLESQNLLKQAEQRVQELNPNCKVHLVSLVGEARDALCDAVKEYKIECIVLGRTGTSKLERIMLGAVSDYVLSHAGCTVILVKK
ncbi:hypothetical protein BJ741DRAFT_623197 [Chytriomyces cf. hyalinus JEL632]|nr:hypothetical protein BJ741DRAFT_623197 [Chytriomyces cf. hyalinus JEL632]